MSSRQLQAFLPAALEVQQTPPLPCNRLILWAILALVITAMIWASIGRVDVVAVARGRIIPSGRVKTVQPLEAGVVKTIHVLEGQQVAAGELLIELDTTETAAEVQRLQQARQALWGDRQRLQASLKALSMDCGAAVDCPVPLLDCPAGTAHCTLNQQRLRQSLNEYRARLQALQDQAAEKRAAHVGLGRRIALLDAILPLITERAQAQQALYRKHLGARVAWLELEQQRIEQDKQRDILRARLAESSAGIGAVEAQIRGMQARFEGDILRQLNEVERRLESLAQELRKAGQRNRLQRLRAPIAGTVQQLAVHTLGGVVTPAQELLKIVPRDESLRVEAWVRNQDIGHIRPGQAAEIKIAAFPFTRYGTLAGRVTRVSSDAVTDEQRGLAYLAQVAMDSSTLRVDGRTLKLGPGMAVTVEVREGRRRIMEFLLDPLLRYRDEALRER